MSRGDQRDRDRQKRQAKEAAKNANGSAREGTPLQRNENDAAKLQAKIAAKQAQKSEQDANAGNTTNAPVPRKKVAKKSDNLDDLLHAGLASGRKTRK
jgi:hypothetical protein